LTNALERRFVICHTDTRRIRAAFSSLNTETNWAGILSQASARF
jgi:hypothetical protein